MSPSEAPLGPFVARPDRSALLFDFDGTLSPIVDDPVQARLVEGAFEVLGELAGSFQVVGLLSGRPVSFLAPLVPPGVMISGLYGLEVVRDGVREDHPTSGAWREVVADVAGCATHRGPEGMVVETKGLSLTLHYRTRPDLAEAVQVWALSQANRSGLVYRNARMSVELHPPIDADKGTAVEAIAADSEAVCFIGDDVGDLPAYDALDRLAATGIHTLKVAVVSEEGPADLVRRADLVLPGPAAVVDFLRGLLDAVASPA